MLHRFTCFSISLQSHEKHHFHHIVSSRNTASTYTGLMSVSMETRPNPIAKSNVLVETFVSVRIIVKLMMSLKFSVPPSGAVCTLRLSHFAAKALSERVFGFLHDAHSFHIRLNCVGLVERFIHASVESQHVVFVSLWPMYCTLSIVYRF